MLASMSALKIFPKTLNAFTVLKNQPQDMIEFEHI